MSHKGICLPYTQSPWLCFLFGLKLSWVSASDMKSGNVGRQYWKCPSRPTVISFCPRPAVKSVREIYGF